MIHDSQHGYILFTTLTFLLILSFLSVAAVTYTLFQFQQATAAKHAKAAFAGAEGGSALCLTELRNRINRDLPATLRNTTIAVVSTYRVNNDPAGFLRDFAYQAGASYGGAMTRVSNAEAALSLSYDPGGGGQPVTCQLSLTSPVAPVRIGEGYLFEYRYSIAGSANTGGTTRQVTYSGSFSILVQPDNFARYALFTNTQRTRSGERVWFTGQTNFYGPVHTNGQFHFALNPSGTFTGPVTSVSQTALFYNNGSPIALDADRNGTRDVPTFQNGFYRGTDPISMPTATAADAQRQKALGGSAPPSTDGVYVQPSTDPTGQSGLGVYVRGDATLTLSVGAGGEARYTIRRGSRTTELVVAGGQTTVTTDESGQPVTTTYPMGLNGMLFVEGNVTGLSGTLQRDAQMTVAATGTVSITNHLTYEVDPRNPPPGVDPQSVLGILSWNGDVVITTTAPNDLQLHAVVMAPNGEFRVDRYNQGSPRGTATLLGGAIQNTYGAFGTFSQSGQQTGYGRNFVYDQRMLQGMIPPFFPTTGLLITTVYGLNDRPTWRSDA